MSKLVNVAVIGLGPRGLVILERLAALLKTQRLNCRFKIHVFEKSELGTGVHLEKQPDYLLLNTICSQINLYADNSVTDVGSLTIGPSFYEWLVTRNLYQNLDPNAYLPRAVLGGYLSDTARKIIKKLRKLCLVYIYPYRVTDIRQVTARQYQVYADNTLAITADYIFLTTGHSSNKPDKRDLHLLNTVEKYKKYNSSLNYFPNPYPIADIPNQIPANSTVAIEGLGLAAFDILAALTVGKNGRYIIDNGHLVYQKSGDEPHIIMYSLDGLPLSGRAYNQKKLGQQYLPRFFNREKIDWLRVNKGTSSHKQLDFELDILPEIIKEIYYGYYTTWLRINHNQLEANEFAKNFIAASNDLHNLNNLVNRFIPKSQQLDWQTFFNPHADNHFSNTIEYKNWLVSFLEKDLTECYQGNVDNPYKAACEIMRDTRDLLRYVIEFSGLTPSSHEIFLKKYLPFINRISIGPPKERIAEMLALIKAGVLNIFIGPEPEVTFDTVANKFQIYGRKIKNCAAYCADVIIKARVPSAIPDSDQSPLIQNALKRGLITAYRNGNFTPGGIAVDKDMHPIDSYQQSHKAIWAIGPLVEGAKFYTFVLPAPAVNSVVFRDANSAVQEMLAAVHCDLQFDNNKDISIDNIITNKIELKK